MFIRRILSFGIMISFLCIGYNTAFSQKTLKVGDVTANPGEKKSGFIRVPAGTDGPEVQIPVTIVNGAKAGPVLALTAGVHGYEYPPVLALQRLRKQLDPSQLSGAVIMVHVANVPSFLKRTIYALASFTLRPNFCNFFNILTSVVNMIWT